MFTTLILPNPILHSEVSERMTACESSSDRYRNGSFYLAISRKVNVGRGAQFFVRNGTRTDRGSCIRTNRPENCKVASAKNPKKWGKLFDFRSVFIDPPQVVENIPSVRITFPDGTHIFSDQDNIDYPKIIS